MVDLFSSDNGFVVLPTSFGGDVELALIEINHELNLIAAVRMLCWHLQLKSSLSLTFVIVGSFAK